MNPSWEAAGALLASALAVSGWALDAPPPHSAEAARLAAQSLLIAIAAAGERLVAVGDRGIIVLSDDQGTSWVQASDVPTQALLTGVCFVDPRHGVAVGHDEAILATADSGRTWKLTHYAPEAQRPLLDVWCGADGRVIAVGAYSAYLTSADGGRSWTPGRLSAAPRPQPASAPASTAGGAAAAAAASERAATDEGAGGGFHLNRVVAAGGARLYIAGEAGHLYRSDDGGGTWQELASPYEGSFFDVLPVAGDVVLAFGLRGNLYRSEDAGSSWQKIQTGTVAMLDGGTRLADQDLVIVGLSGVVLVSRDGGRTFTLAQQSDRSGLSAAVRVGPSRLVAVGEGGARIIDVGSAPGAAGGAR